MPGAERRGTRALLVCAITALALVVRLAGLGDRLSLAFGEHGAGSGAGRWLAAVAVVAVLAAAAYVARAHVVARVATVVAAGDLVLHALAPLAGVEIFNQRYLTALIPLAAILLAAAIDTLDLRWLTAATAAACLLAAVAVFAQRFGRELEPAPPTVRAGGRTIHTNSGVLAFAFLGDDVAVDRPFGLGDGAACAAPCLVVEDRRAPGGLRRNAVFTVASGPFAVGTVPGG